MSGFLTPSRNAKTFRNFFFLFSSQKKKTKQQIRKHKQKTRSTKRWTEMKERSAFYDTFCWAAKAKDFLWLTAAQTCGKGLVQCSTHLPLSKRTYWAGDLIVSYTTKNALNQWICHGLYCSLIRRRGCQSIQWQYKFTIYIKYSRGELWFVSFSFFYGELTYNFICLF